VNWQYGRAENGTPLFVNCNIYEKISPEESVLVASGRAICSQKDIFDKEIGRKLSLSRAMKDHIFLSKEDRRNVWENYHTFGGKKRW